MNVFLRSEDVPESFPYEFTTTGLSKIIPGLSDSFGEGFPVDLQCFVYKVPSVLIGSSIDVIGDLYCDFLVRINPSVNTNAFRLITELRSSFSGNLEIADDRLYLVGRLDEEDSEFSNFSVVNSNIGDFDTNGLIKAIHYYTYYVILQANKVLENDGIPISLPKGVTLSHVEMHIYNGALEIGGEPVFI